MNLGKPAIIGLTGSAQVGKSTVAAFLADAYGYKRIRFADPLKDMLRTFGLTDYELEGAGKEKPCDLLGGHTPRHAMQGLGTEWGRDWMGAAFWTEAWLRRIGQGTAGYVVAEDLRFCNEEFSARLAGAVVWRIERQGYGGTDQHRSETELRHIRYDRLLVNDGTVEDLLAKVRRELET